MAVATVTRRPGNWFTGDRLWFEFEYTPQDEAALQAAWENDPTQSKYRYYKLRRSILDPAKAAALEAAGYRYGKLHWCGGSDVLYDRATWERWDKANPECPVPAAIPGAVTKRSRGRPRIYTTNAERQKAYRNRKAGGT